MRIPLSALAVLAALTCSACDRDAAKATGRVVTNDSRPTGAGDSRYYMPPVGLKIGDVVCSGGSLRYVAVASQPQSHPDETMRQSSRCSRPVLELYAPEDQKGAAPPQLYVKVDTGRYLPVRTAEPLKRRGQDGSKRGEVMARSTVSGD